MRFKIALGQTNPVTGDLQGNTDQIVDCIRAAEKDGSDVVVLPELAITGYCCGALFEQKSFIEYNIKFLEEQIVPIVRKDLVCVVGFVELGNVYSDGTFDIYNSCAVIQNKKIVNVYRKVFLANDGHHEDMKYFTPGDGSNSRVAVKHRSAGRYFSLGTLICEDIWAKGNKDLVSETVSISELLVTINHSYFYYGKRDERMNLVKGIAQKYKIPVVYLNPVGVGDIVKNVMVYDGGSFVANSEGNIPSDGFCNEFRTQYKQVNLSSHSGYITAIHNSKYYSIYRALTYSMREFYRLSGLRKAQIHVSGGLDSAVGACLAVEALGAENCVFISNPTEFNGEETKGFAQHISDSLGVELIWNPTGAIYATVVDEHKKAFGEDPTPAGKASIQAVSRTVQGLAASHTFGTGIIACGNHTELVLGWASFHDIGSIGALSLIGDLTKVEVFQFAEWINKHLDKEVIPPGLFNGDSRPAAELPDSDEDPFDYFVVSGICAEIIRNKKDVTSILEDFKNRTLTEDFFPLDWDGKSIYEKLTEEEFLQEVKSCFWRSKVSVYKAAQSAPVPIISKISRGFSARETLINKYEGSYEF